MDSSMPPEIDYVKIGQRIRSARMDKKLSQAELGALVGCSNNHMSHIEIGQTKVSLTMLMRIAYVLEKSIDYFLLDTPYAKRENIIDAEIAEKLNRCDSVTLLAVNKMLDILLEQQNVWKQTH